MIQLVFLLEEPSAEAFLEGLLPRIFPDGVDFRCIVFEGKSDLEGQLVRRLRGYRVPGARFVVLRDQDSGDCRDIKRGLTRRCVEAGRPEALVRIACRELESWYLGDLPAVESVFGVSGLAALERRVTFRDPDGVAFPYERLRELAPGYQKVGGSRAMGTRISLQGNQSASFRIFVEGVRNLWASRS